MAHKLSTVEEDFRRIGLITEDEDAAGQRQAQTTEEDTSDDDQSLSAFAKTLAEKRKLTRKRRLGSKERMARRKLRLKRRKSRSKLRMKAKKFRRSGKGKRFAKNYARAIKSMGGKIPKGKRLSVSTIKSGIDRISNMVEEVKTLAATALGEDVDFNVEEGDLSETVKSFANIAIIAEMLAQRFQVIGEDDADFSELAQEFTAMAEEAADVAEELDAALSEGAGDEIDTDDLQEQFKLAMDDLLDGLDLYSDLTEGSDEDEDEDEEDDDSTP